MQKTFVIKYGKLKPLYKQKVIIHETIFKELSVSGNYKSIFKSNHKNKILEIFIQCFKSSLLKKIFLFWENVVFFFFFLLNMQKFRYFYIKHINLFLIFLMKYKCFLQKLNIKKQKYKNVLEIFVLLRVPGDQRFQKGVKNFLFEKLHF